MRNIAPAIAILSRGLPGRYNAEAARMGRRDPFASLRMTAGGDGALGQHALPATSDPCREGNHRFWAEMGPEWPKMAVFAET